MPLASRRSLTRLVRRHRRLLAGLLAGTAALLGLTSLAAAPATPAPTPAGAPVAAPGSALVPVTLAPAGVAAALRVGDAVDLLAAREGAPAVLVAEDARVAALPEGAGAFSASTSGVVLVEVPEEAARALSASASAAPLAVVVHRTIR